MTSAAEWVIAADTAFVDDGLRVVAISLADLAACQPHVLEETAASVWRALRVRQESAIIRNVASAYDLDTVAVADDVRSFLHQLRAKGLVRKVG